MNDETVDEVRRARDAYASQFGYDVRRIAEDLRRREREGGRQYVNLPPKAPMPVRPVPKAG